MRINPQVRKARTCEVPGLVYLRRAGSGKPPYRHGFRRRPSAKLVKREAHGTLWVTRSQLASWRAVPEAVARVAADEPSQRVEDDGPARRSPNVLQEPREYLCGCWYMLRTGGGWLSS